MQIIKNNLEKLVSQRLYNKVSKIYGTVLAVREASCEDITCKGFCPVNHKVLMMEEEGRNCADGTGVGRCWSIFYTREEFNKEWNLSKAQRDYNYP